MKVRSNNAKICAGPVIYGGKNSFPITNLPIYLNVYEARFVENEGLIQWNLVSLKPLTFSTRLLNIQLRGYFYKDQNTFQFQYKFLPDPIFDQYKTQVSWNITTPQGNFTLGNSSKVYNAVDYLTSSFNDISDVLTMEFRKPSSVPSTDYLNFFFNIFIG